MKDPDRLFPKYVHGAPCKDCSMRMPNEEHPDAPNCHMSCKAYLAYSKERERIRQKISEEHQLNLPLKKGRHGNNSLAWNAMLKRRS